ncbi:cytochrome P450, family 2, subfamily V, polypeptide 1 isoform X2 [Sinocyclocheilus rhinocerous]|uniref:cytochrome P450, family 2, subfamily V, polypeptide 1 isoform X2 n=1 Tax=Sinocyclocheilus rhinocerous TaxID=307959 RepID=UPI0007B81782|nr:PREDICTED: cytochrome P450 2J3-like isoform X2 [Sinocyclocheilus rhinocerous]
MVLENILLSLASVQWTDVGTVLLMFVIFLLISDHLRNRKPRNYPPGPTPLPFIGNAFNLDAKQPHIHLTKMSDRYGNIFSLRLGSLNTVVVNTYSMVKKTLIDHANIFTGRPTNDVLKRIIKCQGVTFNNGYSWKQRRRFTLSTLKYFGVGKRSLEVIIMEEYKFLHQTIMETNEVDKHYADWDPSSPRDFIDCYLTEIQKRKDDLEAGFHEEGLQYAVLDLFVAGTETTSTTLLWAFVYMMKYPEIQEKVQQEIDKVVGRSRRPNIDDRPSMPYTDAVIHEVQRMGNVVPLSVPRVTNEDSILEGYHIPKGTQIIPNLTSVLFDQTKWKTPYSFDPQNFLNAQGKFEKPEAFIPFSAGKRSCPGESLARMELFLFFTSFLQSVTLSPPGRKQTSLDFKFGMTLSPKPFKISFTPR